MNEKMKAFFAAKTKGTAMAENVNPNPNEPEKLSDDELAHVSGGRGWSRHDEEACMDIFRDTSRMCERLGTPYASTFEEYLAQEDPSGQLLKDRQAWIDAGRPRDGWYYAD